MSKKKISKTKKSIQTVEIPGQGSIILGSGAVPTSQTSASTTNISEMISASRRAVIRGTFEKECDDGSSGLL